MYQIVVLSRSTKLNSLLLEITTPILYTTLHFCSTIKETKEFISSHHPDLLIINEPSDLNTLLLFKETIQLIFALFKQEHYDKINEDCLKNGIYSMSKATSKQALKNNILFLLTTIENEKNILNEKINEIKKIDEAKWELIINQKMTEPEAHHYIEQKAMNLNITKLEAAILILAMNGK